MYCWYSFITQSVLTQYCVQHDNDNDKTVVSLQTHWQEKTYNLLCFECFRLVTRIRIHGWLWNDTLLIEAWERFPIVFQGHPWKFKVSRTENRRFGSDLGTITRPVAAIKFLSFGVLFWSLSCSLSNWRMHFLWVLWRRTFSGRAISCWYGSENVSLKVVSSAKLSFEAQSIFDALTW